MSYSEALEQQVALLRAWGHYGTWEHLLVDRLRTAETYWLSDTVRPLVLHGAQSLPAATTVTLTLPPSPEGFVYLETPVNVWVSGHVQARLHALQWLPVRMRPGLQDPVGSAYFAPGDIEGFAILSYVESGGLIRPGLMGQWYFSHTFREVGVIHANQRDSEMSDDDVTTNLMAVALWASFCLFVKQRILVTRSQLAERHTRKRLERERWGATPLVRVVELRSKEARRHPAVEPVEREWSCQWVVRGHWRQQFYPSKHQTQPIWITPYVKGPENKPLRPPRATVFAVVR